MSFQRRWLSMGLPLTLLVFLWVTMRTVSAYSTEAMTGFGFPLSWYATNEATSTAYTVAIFPLVFDLVVYIFSTILLQWLYADRLLIRLNFSSTASKGMSALLWFAACLSLLITTLILVPNIRIELMAVNTYFGNNATRSCSLALGLQPL
ncbi:MAG: hypothetical protein ABL903_09485 [Methylococcales bacterium]